MCGKGLYLLVHNKILDWFNLLTGEVKYMEIINLYFVLVLSEARNKELNRKVEGFERITEALTTEVDRQRKEIELIKQRGKVLKFNRLRKVA
jgi:hypothetical protein